ncbi:MAG TPA: right-handed parallel beta-helix repeat-containing protein [Pseudonocardiaceae bacterium]|nr:right-handed parallel beta-helix repeat-containing protein [Pseudonocardiaceae bacterium]
MRPTRLLALLAAVLAIFGLGGIATADPAPPPLQLYAAPYGAGPLCAWFLPCSITTAQQQVRRLDQNLNRDLKVNLAGGTYRLTAPLQLGAADSGTNGYHVIWAAEPGATPVFSGGQQITGWHLSDPTKNIWSAPAPANLHTRQLYVNGVRAQRAGGPLPVALTMTPTGYTASSDLMASWRNPGDLEFVYTGGAPYWSLKVGGEGAWTEPRCPVASISGTTITMAQPCWDNSTQRLQRNDGSGRSYNLVHNGNLGNGSIPAYVDNAYELLDQPGEWYLDSSAHQIYYIPRAGEQLRRADVEAPVLQQLVTGNGTHDIEFDGIQFAYATWLTPSTGDGFSEVQANYTLTGQGAYATQGLCQFIAGGTCPYGNWTKEPGNLSFSDDTDIQFRDDAFVHLGAAGLDLGDGSQSDTVQGSVFTDISGNGLEIGGVDIPEPTTQAQHTSGVSVLDNHLYGLPVEYHGGVAIDVGYAEHTLISHNQIDHTAYTAISLGWGGWPDKIKVAATPNYSNNNTVSDNQISDAMQLLADGGAIYTQGITGTSLADGEHLTGNVITGILDNGHAMYCDNGCTYWTADGNVLVGNISNDWGARHTDYTAGQTGDDPLEVSGNYWWQGDADSSSKNTVVSGNHVIAGLTAAPASITSAAGLEPQYRHILAESFGTSAPDAPAQVAAFAVNGSACVGWNPSFVDNGAPVTGYTVTASPGGEQATLSAADLAKLGYAIMPGLTQRHRVHVHRHRAQRVRHQRAVPPVGPGHARRRHRDLREVHLAWCCLGPARQRRRHRPDHPGLGFGRHARHPGHVDLRPGHRDRPGDLLGWHQPTVHAHRAGLVRDAARRRRHRLHQCLPQPARQRAADPPNHRLLRQRAHRRDQDRHRHRAAERRPGRVRHARAARLRDEPRCDPGRPLRRLRQRRRHRRRRNGSRQHRRLRLQLLRASPGRLRRRARRPDRHPVGRARCADLGQRQPRRRRGQHPLHPAILGRDQPDHRLHHHSARHRAGSGDRPRFPVGGQRKRTVHSGRWPDRRHRLHVHHHRRQRGWSGYPGHRHRDPHRLRIGQSGPARVTAAPAMLALSGGKPARCRRRGGAR